MVAVRITLQQLVVPRWMDNSTLPIKKSGKYIPANQQSAEDDPPQKKTPHLSARLEGRTYGHSVLI